MNNNNMKLISITEYDETTGEEVTLYDEVKEYEIKEGDVIEEVEEEEVIKKGRGRPKKTTGLYIDDNGNWSSKLYWEATKDKKEKQRKKLSKCVCGAVVRKDQLSTHLKTKRHLKLMAFNIQNL